MMKYLFTAVLIAGSLNTDAQTWKLNMELGANAGRLLPTVGSTAQAGTLKYGYSGPGMYLGTGAQLKISKALDATFNYQFSNTRVGVQHQSYNASFKNYDGVAMHNLSLGLEGQIPVCKGHMMAGAFIRSGFSYHKMQAMGSAGSAGGDISGAMAGGAAYSSMSRSSGFDALPGDWTPTSTAGVSLGTNTGKKIDRFSLRWSATMNWRNTYSDYSEYDYLISTTGGAESGTVKYQGRIWMMQFGINYRLAGFGGKG